MVLGRLVLFKFLYDNLNVTNVLSDGHALLLEALLDGQSCLALFLVAGNFLLGISQLLLKLLLLTIGSSLSVVVLAQVALLFLNLGHEHLLLLSQHLVFLQQLHLLVHLHLVIVIDGSTLCLQPSQLLVGIQSANHGTSGLDENEPSPVTEVEVLLELPLCHLDQLPLVVLLLVPRYQHTLEHFSLELPDQTVHQPVPALLHHTESTGAEEDDGVSCGVPMKDALSFIIAYQAYSARGGSQPCPSERTQPPCCLQRKLR